MRVVRFLPFAAIFDIRAMRIACSSPVSIYFRKTLPFKQFRAITCDDREDRGNKGDLP
jgi:hypothetical protein